ncbi:hypothetical protein BOX15_Mlig030170g1 [Macrostomum lignano]|uniref:Xylose isomerase n=2 Tax=Macrostomum lignano TaxID=282301 RepID=A0A267E0P2_9PLAT|nr:hypothetical protein BOX15_Mlig030170g1 [Macrostomum lignano]
MAEMVEYFPGIGKIQYCPDAPPTETLCFKYYNPSEVILGKPMSEWLRFSVVFWHTFRGTGLDPFGAPTLSRAWNRPAETVDDAKRRLDAAFEFFTKLGVQFYTFHDRDIAPEGASLAETNANLEAVVEHALELQQRTGVQLLWATCNLFSNPRYMHGAATSPLAEVFAYAGAQVKKGLEVAKKLGALNYVFWGGREGYASLLNTRLREELDHMANFFRMVVAYKKKIGFTGQLLIEPKPKEPTSHQYDYDAMTVIGFLRTYGLQEEFKLNIEPNHTTLAGHCHEHDIAMASAFGCLGSVDANTGSPELGWDTDQFPMSVRDCTAVMRYVLAQGGLAPGGLNFDCKVRRESTSLTDMFAAHIGAMDTFARGLRCAAKMQQDGVLDGLVATRYASYRDSELGRSIADGTATLESLEAHILKHGEPEVPSGQQETFELIFNRYL